MPLGGLLAIGGGTGLGILKSLAFDAPRAKRQNKLAAETIRNSPWTGMLPQAVEEPNYMGSAVQGAALGGLAGQGLGLFDKAAPLSPTEGGGGVPTSDDWYSLLKSQKGVPDSDSWRAMMGSKVWGNK